VEREPSMSSLKVRAEKEKELAEAETYWKERLHKLEHEVRGPFLTAWFAPRGEICTEG
jgi:hypothetical protein